MRWMADRFPLLTQYRSKGSDTYTGILSKEHMNINIGSEETRNYS